MNEGERLDVFVVALDDFHLRELRSIRDAERYRFHRLLSMDEAVNAVLIARELQNRVGGAD